MRLKWLRYVPLQDADYYASRYRQTHQLRRQLAQQLACQALDVVPGVANFLLCRVPADAASAAVEHCRQHDVFLRDAESMGTRIGNRCLRIAVKCSDDNRRIAATIRTSLGRSEAGA